ncbi:GMC oxidoreductase [Camillea tinctor]|nr:GMC oxidoreductase [Camillea tinctor]
MISKWHKALPGTLLLSLVLPSSSSWVGERADATYDYVIVGGGTAGLTLAARLSEDNVTTVAVIEAGTYYQISNPLLSQTPAGDIFWTGTSPLDVNPAVDWDFITTAQAGANNRELHYARGKCLGGSSGRNLMIYQRPDTGSLQEWADQVDDQSYTWDNFQPYFKKSITFTPPGSTRFQNATTSYDAAAFASSGGPLHVSYANYVNSFSTWLGSAFNEIGINDTTDFNSGSLMGSQYCTSTIDPTTAFRSSSQTAFLEASQARPNLKVFYLTLAKKIIFDDSKTAVGVQVGSGDTLYAKKEVILSAGAFQSPQLLMVSGVGPADVLQDLGIDVVADRPGVGQNMTDHIMFGPSYRVDVQTTGSVLQDPAALYNEIVNNYFTKAQGILTNPIVDWLAWEKAPRDLISNSSVGVLSKYPESWPDIEYLTLPAYFGNGAGVLVNPDAPTDGYNYATVVASLVSPNSRGNVTITSADASDAAIINPNWLTNPVDQDVAVAAFKRLRGAFASSAMQPVLADPTEYYPGPAVQTDEQILNFVRDNLVPIYHASTTCRMGRKDDPNAVVDSTAKVLGVSGLRVVDASSFALLPPGHPQSTVYALAEKIADDIINGV